MPSYKDTYKQESNYLKVEDLEKKRRSVTIKEVTQEKIGDDVKLALAFAETPKKLVLNVTNCRMMEMLTGADDTDKWQGLTITLRPDMTSFNGKPVPCIRIDSELPDQKQVATVGAAASVFKGDIPWDDQF